MLVNSKTRRRASGTKYKREKPLLLRPVVVVKVLGLSPVLGFNDSTSGPLVDKLLTNLIHGKFMRIKSETVLYPKSRRGGRFPS